MWNWQTYENTHGPESEVSSQFDIISNNRFQLDSIESDDSGKGSLYSYRVAKR